MIRKLFLMTLLGIAAWGETILTVDRGTTYDLSYLKSCDCWSVRIFVTPAAAYAGHDIDAAVVGIAMGTQSPADLVLEKPKAVNVDKALVGFDFSTPSGTKPPHAVFDTIVEFQSGTSKQRQTFQFTVPAAVLRQPETLQIQRAVPFMWFRGEDFMPPLVLAPSDKSRAPAWVTITKEGQFSDADRDYGGELVFDSSGKPVPQDGSQDFTYKAFGDFPLGTAKASLIVSSRQLEGPLTVPVEVRTRRVKEVLWFLIVAGLLLGFLLRTWLKQQVQYTDLKQQAVDTLEQIGTEGAKEKDRVYRDSVKAAASALETTIKRTTRRNQQDLTDAINTARKALGEAKAGLANRLVKTNEAVQEFTTLTTTPWRISAAIATGLRQAAKSILAINVALSQNDATRASSLLEKEAAQLRKFLLEAIAEWQRGWAGILEQLNVAALVMIDPARATMIKRVADLRTRLDQIPQRTAETTITDYLADIRAIDLITGAALLPLDTAGAAVKNAWTAIDTELKSKSQLPNREKWEATTKPTTDYAAKLDKASAHLTTDLHLDIATAGMELHRSWSEALLAQVADPEALKELIDKGQFVEAAERVPDRPGAVEDAIMGKAGSGKVKRKSATEVSRSGAASFDLRTEVEPVEESTGADVPGGVEVDGHPSLQRLRRLTWRDMIAAKSAQFAISATGLAIVGYLLFSDKFVGTGPEMLTAFFWGFTTDVGLDALITAAKAKPAA